MKKSIKLMAVAGLFLLCNTTQAQLSKTIGNVSTKHQELKTKANDHKEDAKAKHQELKGKAEAHKETAEAHKEELKGKVDAHKETAEAHKEELKGKVDAHKETAEAHKNSALNKKDEAVNNSNLEKLTEINEKKEAQISKIQNLKEKLAAKKAELLEQKESHSISDEAAALKESKINKAEEILNNLKGLL